MKPLIHTFSLPGKFYLYDANSNSILTLSNEQYKLANEIEKGNADEEAHEFLKRYQKQGFLIEPDIQEIEHPEINDLEYHLGRKIEMLTLQVTQNCNLRCDYCVYSGQYNTRSHSSMRMSFETAKKAIDTVLEHTIDTKTFFLGFYGGEPLLELDLIEKCITYIRKRSNGLELGFSITTNGTLLSCEVYEWLGNLGGSLAWKAL